MFYKIIKQCQGLQGPSENLTQIDNNLRRWHLASIQNLSTKKRQMETIMSFFKYLHTGAIIYILCSSVWHFCGACNAEKTDILNKCILNVILKDYTWNSRYGNLQDKINLKPLYIRCLQNFLVIPYKSLFFNNYQYPRYLSTGNMFTLHTTTYSLHGNYILSLPNPNTTIYGMHTFSYLAA